jgi:hypothetical protein
MNVYLPHRLDIVICGTHCLFTMYCFCHGECVGGGVFFGSSDRAVGPGSFEVGGRALSGPFPDLEHFCDG